MASARKLTHWICAVSTLALLLPAMAADTKAWKSRSIYQAMTDRFARTDGSTIDAYNTTAGLYCGGTWRGMIDRLDYIQGMGFDAVRVSPIVKNVEGRVSYGEAYHGYWLQNMYALTPHFGSREDLLDLSNALHGRGMFLMMDTVIYNMAYITNGTSPEGNINFTRLNPFNDPKCFHSYYRITDYDDYPLAQKCWTGDDSDPLPDLKTEDKIVQTMLEMWIKETMSTYSIDGLRLDAAKHVTPEFLPLFQKATGDSFVTGEVFDKSVQSICGYQDHLTSSLPDQVQIMKHNCRDVTTLVTFSENHDIARFASFKKNMNLAKNVDLEYLNTRTSPIFRGSSEMAFRKGREGRQIVMVLSTQGTNSSAYTAQVINRYQPSYIIIDVLTCDKYKVNEWGEIRLPMGSLGKDKIFV
ncbi:glycoside hydrolase superfamily [Aspergillus novoparasiticus]|uniref:alpha-amylase n=1 Tax=Aspergillus novoparasiticus TaxID=986946 RepID=A0A5N6F860_9EURO|nr:glycoside hydrolase superfamily [Aspergillus novoparasiticus]